MLPASKALEERFVEQVLLVLTSGYQLKPLVFAPEEHLDQFENAPEGHEERLALAVALAVG